MSKSQCDLLLRTLSSPSPATGEDVTRGRAPLHHLRSSRRKHEHAMYLKRLHDTAQKAAAAFGPRWVPRSGTSGTEACSPRLRGIEGICGNFGTV